jgi:hypothetical protein
MILRRQIVARILGGGHLVGGVTIPECFIVGISGGGWLGERQVGRVGFVVGSKSGL